MKGLLVNILLGLVLFLASLLAGLYLTGRLSHDGTANIPLLNLLFSAPPADHAAPAVDHAPPGAAPAGETQVAVHDGERSVADAGHASPPDPGARRQKVGASVVDPDQPQAGGQSDGNRADDRAAERRPAGAAPVPPAGHQQTPERDFDGLQRALASQGRTSYTPGDYFRFDGMPSSLTPTQINEAWQRVQGVTQDLERRRTALDLRDQELQELADDIARRWKELGEERLQIEQMQRQLDARIQRFQETVKVVRNDEVAALKRNAATLAAFERSKAAELVEDQWRTERGQEEVLKLLEFMDRDAVNEILALLPKPMVQDLLAKRLRVGKESAPSGRRN